MKQCTALIQSPPKECNSCIANPVLHDPKWSVTTSTESYWLDWILWKYIYQKTALEGSKCQLVWGFGASGFFSIYFSFAFFHVQSFITKNHLSSPFPPGKRFSSSKRSWNFLLLTFQELTLSLNYLPFCPAALLVDQRRSVLCCSKVQENILGWQDLVR